MPRAMVSLRVLSQVANQSVRSRLLTKLYRLCLNEKINEWKYEVGTAGIGIDVDDIDGGLKLKMDGYSQHLPAVLRDLVQRLPNIDIEPKTFASLKEALARDLESAEFEPAYRRSMYEISNFMDPLSFHRKQYPAILKAITLDDVKKFAADFRKKTALVGVGFGNIKSSELKAVLDGIHGQLGSQKLARADWPLPRTLKIEKGKKLALLGATPTNNNGFASISLINDRSARIEALMGLAEAHFGASFYTELRTQQQLGYIVAAQSFETWQTQGLLFLIQSSTHELGDVAKKVKNWKDQSVKSLASLDEKTFEEYKSALIARMNQGAVDQEERLQELFMDGIILKGQFDRKSVVVKEIEAVKLADFKKEMTNFLKGDSGPTLTSYVVRKDGKTPKPTESLVTDLEGFRHKQAKL